MKGYRREQLRLQRFKPSSPDFWNSLSKSTRNALLRDEKARGYTVAMRSEPWNYSIKQLLQIPGIGPSKIEEIARLTERYCV